MGVMLNQSRVVSVQCVRPCAECQRCSERGDIRVLEVRVAFGQSCGRFMFGKDISVNRACSNADAQQRNRPASVGCGQDGNSGFGNSQTTRSRSRRVSSQLATYVFDNCPANPVQLVWLRGRRMTGETADKRFYAQVVSLNRGTLSRCVYKSLRCWIKKQFDAKSFAAGFGACTILLIINARNSLYADNPPAIVGVPTWSPLEVIRTASFSRSKTIRG